MPGIRDLKSRIRSNQSTRKITRAMQMVSAAKMRKAQTAVMQSRTYSSLAWELILNLSSKVRTNGPLMVTYPRAKKVGVVLLGSNRGLVGSLNSNLGPKLKELNNAEIISEVTVYGRQAKTVANRTGENIVADFNKIDKSLTSEDIYPLAKYITDAYATGEYKSIVIVYNHFVSTLIQKPTVKELLPFMPVESGVLPEKDAPVNAEEEVENRDIETDYLFEPGPRAVLEHLIPRIIESQVYQAVLESDASEHSARMVMMKNATEAAGDLIADLTLTFNQLRQNKITTELAEITAGRIALE